MSSYHDLKQAAERDQHARELRMAHEEIDMLKREIYALKLERDHWKHKYQEPRRTDISPKED